jgi:hypothetical protein
MPIPNERYIVTSSGHSQEGTVTDHELEGLRAKLAARQGVCWLRLEDAVAELLSLHSVSEEEILTRIRAMIESERSVLDTDRS